MEILDEVLEAMRERDKVTERVDKLEDEREILLQTLSHIHGITELKLRLCKEAIRRNNVVQALIRLQERIENGKETGKESRRPNH